MKSVKPRKITDEPLTEEIIKTRRGPGIYPECAWMKFSRALLSRGYSLSLYEARQTVSKYITVHGINDDFYTVRFSDHRPNIKRELNRDCDFFVGVTNFSVTNWKQALSAVLKHFGAYDETIE